MHRMIGTRRFSRLGIAALAVVLGLGAWTAAPGPAAAQFWYGFGPRYYASFPYSYPPPAYYPYYPPSAYYPPAAPAGYPPPAAGAPEVPGVGAPVDATALGAPGVPQPRAPQPSAAITYTDRPAFRNAAGQTCREYRSANGALGSACRDPSGQWRVAN
jgi:hypothetical protein